MRCDVIEEGGMYCMYESIYACMHVLYVGTACTVGGS